VKLALTPIVERLRGLGCRQVEGVLELLEVRDGPRALPALYVVPGRERAGANALAGAIDQAVDVEFSVIVVVDGTRRNRAGISEEIKTQVEIVVQAIAGWTHPEASRACELGGGGMASAGGRSVAWEVRFRSRYHFRKTR
jgi:hypothetical protein